MQNLSGKIQDRGMCNSMYNPGFDYGKGPGYTTRDECRKFAGTCNSGFDKNLNYCLAKKAKKDNEYFCANYFNEIGRDYPPVYIRNIKLKEDQEYQDIVDDDLYNGCAQEYKWTELSFRRPDKNKYKKIGKKFTPRRSRRKSKHLSTKKSPRKSPRKSKRRSTRKSPRKSNTKKSPRKSPSRSTRKR